MADFEPVFRSPPTQEATRLSVIAFAAQARDVVHFCPKCAHVGYVFEEDLSEFSCGGWYRKHPCECNSDTIRGRAAMREAGAPDAFVGATLSGWNNMGRTQAEKRDNERVMERCLEIVRRMGEASSDGLNVWLSGSQGSGKTWVACSLLREAILAWGYTGSFFPATEIVRASIHDEHRFSALYNVGWLVLDGIDRMPRTQTGYEGTTLLALLNHRVQNRAPTIFTSRGPLHEVHGMYGDPAGKDIVNLLIPVTVHFALVGGDFTESKGIRQKWETP